MNTYIVTHRKGKKITQHAVVRKSDATDMAYCLVARAKGSSASVCRTKGVMTWGVRRGLRSVSFRWKGQAIVTTCAKPKTPKQPNYTHRDGTGMAWRFVGSRPVSALADKVMADCGMPLR